jgi:hypothetical protein
MMQPVATPVLFLIFNRPDLTSRMMDMFRQARPKRFFIVADGPRQDVRGEEEMCRQAREIAAAVDWEAEVKTWFREENYGCGKSYSTAIDWFFEQVEEGIILEDDCLPGMDFFPFAAEMLERYRHDTRVMMICGTNRMGLWKDSIADYFFTHYPNSWGWATWRRAWSHFDYSMSLLDRVYKEGELENIFTDRREYRLRMKEYYLADRISSMFYRWDFAMAVNSGLTIIPSKNLVKNTGFRNDSTHTFRTPDDYDIHSLYFPLRHPVVIADDKGYAKFRIRERVPRLPRRIIRRLKAEWYKLRNR